MSPQVQTFVALLHAARGGDAYSAKLVRDICRNAVDAAPDQDLYRIADAIIALAPEPTLPVERN